MVNTKSLLCQNVLFRGQDSRWAFAKQGNNKTPGDYKAKAQAGNQVQSKPTTETKKGSVLGAWEPESWGSASPLQ